MFHHYVHGPVPLTPSPLTPCPNPKSPNPLSQPPGNPKGVLAPTDHDVPPYVHGPVPLTPSPLTPCPNPESPNPLSQPPGNPQGVLAPTHHDVPPYVHCPVPLTPGPLTPTLCSWSRAPNPKSPNPLSQPRGDSNPLSQPPGNPKGVLAPTHHDVPPYVHGPVPLTPGPLTPCPNRKSPNPLSQPPGNPQGVLVPKHHDVPPTHHFFLFFKGCTATSDVILASHLWLLQVTGFVVSQVTRVPWSPLQAPFKPPWNPFEAPLKPPWSLPKVKPPSSLREGYLWRVLCWRRSPLRHWRVPFLKVSGTFLNIQWLDFQCKARGSFTEAPPFGWHG